LKAGTVIGKFSNTVEYEVDNFLSNSVMTPSVIVSGIFLTTNNLLRMIKLSVSTTPNLVTHSRLKVNVNRTRDVLPSSSLAKKGVKGIIASTDGFVRGHLTIGLNAVLETVQLPASVSGLDTGLAHVDGDTFAHICCFGFEQKEKAKREGITCVLECCFSS
jgi:hypothetical protein